MERIVVVNAEMASFAPPSLQDELVDIVVQGLRIKSKTGEASVDVVRSETLTRIVKRRCW